MAERLGLPFLFGFYGIEPIPETVRLLRETGACGVLLLRRNIETAEQVRALIESLEDAVGHRLLVAIDHEGGLITRFSRDITPFPGNMALGRTETPSLAYEVGRCMASELVPLGIHINLAPVLDVVTAQWNPGITIRSLGSDPERVSLLGAELIRGMQEGGLSATAKHFPGKGAATVDAHVTMPTVGLSRSELETIHLAPFRAAIRMGVDLVMSSHVQYVAYDPTPKSPATWSHSIATDLLRSVCGFGGVLISDDLAMGGITEGTSVEEASVRAAQAGHDILLIAHEVECMNRAFEAYRKALESKAIDPAKADESRSRIHLLLEKHASRKPSRQEDEETDARSLSEIIAGAAVHVERDPQQLIPVKRGRHTGLLMPRLLDLGPKLLVDDELRGAAGLLQGWIREITPTVDVLEIPMDPKEDLFRMILEWCGAVDVVIDFVFDAKQLAGSRRVLEEVQRRHPRVIVVPIRNPWDRELVGPRHSIVQTYGFRVPQLAAAIDLIFRGS